MELERVVADCNAPLAWAEQEIVELRQKLALASEERACLETLLSEAQAQLEAISSVVGQRSKGGVINSVTSPSTSEPDREVDAARRPATIDGVVSV